MKKPLAFLMITLLVVLYGCSVNTMSHQLIKDINGVSMVSAKEASALIGLNYSEKDNRIELTQDQITLRINIGRPFVYRDKYVMYVMEGSALKEGNTIYLPKSFFSDYLGETIKSENNQLSLSDRKVFSLFDIVKFLPEEVLGAINNANYPNRNKIILAVELPRSMNITIPKINSEKIIDTTPLSSYTGVFKANLLQHGFSQKEVAEFSYNDYRVIESSWKLSDQMITSAKHSYPELKDKDLSKWTYGE